MFDSVNNSDAERVIFSGAEYFASLLKDLEQAVSSIDLEAYIFSLDSMGKSVLRALTVAARRGVTVRVMVDGAGTPDWGGHFVRALERAGGESGVFHPFPWRLWQWSRTMIAATSVIKALYLFSKINSRNHRKVCIIDRKIAYVGSFNISQNHISSKNGSEGWRDTGVRLEQIDLSELIQAFQAAWSYTPIQERIKHYFHHIKTNPIIRLNNNWHRRRILYKDLLNHIQNCTSRIWITNAYFVPDKFLLRRLIEAAKRNIDVRILLPAESDIAFMPWASKIFYGQLLKAGVRIFEYLPVMLHAKTLIIDDWMTIGSSNLNHRSLLHDLEVDINIRSLNAKAQLEQQFVLDLTKSREVFLQEIQQRSWYQDLVGNIILYLKYIL